MRLPLAVTAVGTSVFSPVVLGQPPQETSPVSKQVVAHQTAMSERGAALTFEFADGSELTVALTRGIVQIDGSQVATFERGGALEQSWQALIEQAGNLDPAEMLQAAQSWNLPDPAADGQAFRRIAASLTTLQAPPAVGRPPPVAAIPPVPIPPPATSARQFDRLSIDDLRNRLRNERLQLNNMSLTVGDVTIAQGETIDGGIAVLRGDVHVEGHVTGDVVALEGDVLLHGGGVVDGSVLAMNGEVIRGGGVVHGSIRSVSSVDGGVRRERIAQGSGFRSEPSVIGSIGANLAGLVASFVALAGIGFGLVLVAPRQLETVADTVRGSFWRSFLAGVLAQSLLVPVTGLLIIGLMLTVVGILLLPFAVLALLALTICAVVGGYLAAARSTGEVFLRRRMALGHAVGGWLPYRYLLYGLMLLMAVWGPAFVFGWVPIAGFMVLLFAALFTWVMISAGFGATIISRAGIRGTFVRRFDGVMTDQYLYETPVATPVVRRLRKGDKDS